VRFDSAVYRAIAKESGAHLYLDSDDMVSASDNFVGITAISDGTKCLELPAKCTLIDAFSGQTVGAGIDKYSFSMKKGETRLFLLRKQQ